MSKFCSACEKSLKTCDLKSCTVCDNHYHFQCLRITPENFAKESRAHKASWRCPQCRATERRSDNANTPVRQPAPAGAPSSPAHSPPASSPSADFLQLREHIDSSLARLKTEILNEVTLKLEKCSKESEQQRDQLLQDIRIIKNKFVAIEKKQEKIESSLTNLSGFYDDLKKDNKTLADENIQLKAKIASLTKTSLDMQQQINDVQSYITSKFIEIRNVPPNNEENLLDCFNKLCSALGVEYKPNHISNIYRKRTYKQDSQHILVELNNESYKRDLLAAVKERIIKRADKLNTQHIGMQGDPKHIYISELLSSKQKRVYFKARQHAKAQQYDYCWIKNGKVYLRKHSSEPAILVRDEEQLSELAASQAGAGASPAGPASPARRPPRPTRAD